ncbi:MAG: hypothetical protein CME31_21570 [Gimesia sp.]|uniref:Uncharacterized protein n=1 Tax=Gimesia maris TaxID=122 RepID=A0A3D3R298_9PLAN|nr:hypothetical protein [Gimesia sp.]HCO22212.1 hypothetical protein [Gimesia maris]|tara:strand:+ start:96134 stop:96865 length:732 start_codon:yes stop_codon:yes gene_type:complete
MLHNNNDELHKLSPHKLPCYRWNFAVRLSEAPEPDMNIADDQITKDATAYLKSKDKEKFPDIYEAYKIYRDDGYERAHIEACILAGLTVDQVADWSCVYPRIIRVYEALFFSVRERDIPFDRLLQYTVGDCLITGFKNHQVRQFWAWLALHTPFEFFEHAIYPMEAELSETDDDSPALSLYLRPDSSVPIYFQTMIAECVAPFINPQIEWIRAFAHYYQQFRELPTSKELRYLDHNVDREVKR